MRAKLTLERFDKGRKLLERKEQLSRSFTLEFLRLLYVQHAQATSVNISANAQNCRVVSTPGYAPFLSENMMGFHYGIVVGEGVVTPAPTDTLLSVPILHGKNFKGTPAQFTNPGFETGDLTGWTIIAGSPTVVAGGYAGSGGAYYCNIPGGNGAGISQNVDLTNALGLAIQAYGYSDGASGDIIRVYVDAVLAYSRHLTGISYFGPGTLLVPLSYSGVHTIKIQIYFNIMGTWLRIDNIQTWGKELEYGGSEVLEPVFADPNGSSVMRRFFTNNSGNAITVNEAGIVAYPGRLIVHDAVSPGIDIAGGELLKVTYTMGITV